MSNHEYFVPRQLICGNYLFDETVFERLYLFIIILILCDVLAFEQLFLFKNELLCL